MWEEVAKAKEEGRRELVLSGKGVEERVAKAGLDAKIFALKPLNFLEVSHAGLASLPAEVANLSNLTSLVLKGNQLTSLPPLSSLTAIKLIDVSLNKLTSLPDLAPLSALETLNLSLNQLAGELGEGAGLQGCTRLSVVEVTGNQLTGLGELQGAKMEYLAVITANQNLLSSLEPALAANWPALKKLDLTGNQLKEVPGELGVVPSSRTPPTSTTSPSSCSSSSIRFLQQLERLKKFYYSCSKLQYFNSSTSSTSCRCPPSLPVRPTSLWPRSWPGT